MKIVETILTKNRCYLAGKKITPKGLMLHSVGCNQPSAEVFVKKWNSQSSGDVCVHAFIDGNTGTVYQTLPWDHRAWHCGRSGNNTHIGVEMCEPSTIRYTGGSSWVDNDPAKTKATVLRTYNSAVELFAYLCKKYKLNPLADGVIVSHSEGCKRGIASNHGDVEHIWRKFDLTMDKFRKDVNAKLNEKPVASTTSPVKTNTSIKKGALVSITKGAKYYNGKSVPSWVSGTKWYVASVSGNRAVIDKSEDGKNSINSPIDVKYLKIASKTATPTIKVGSTVKVKKGAKTYDGKALADFVYNRKHKVKELNGNRAVITYSGVTVCAIDVKNLTLA